MIPNSIVLNVQKTPVLGRLWVINNGNIGFWEMLGFGKGKKVDIYYFL